MNDPRNHTKPHENSLIQFRAISRVLVARFLPMLLLIVFLIFAAPQASGQETSKPEGPAETLDKRVRADVARFNGKVYLYAKNLDTGAVYQFNGDDRVPTASTIKIAVLIEAHARVAEGKVKWTDELILTKEKKVGGAGILQEFSDGLHLTLRDAATLMMILSDNTATNLVIDVLSADAVNARMASLGFKDTRLMRRVFGGGASVEGKKEENKRFGLGRTSPHEMVSILDKLERGEIVNAAASKEMLDLLKREQGTNGIWRNQWRETKATKSGALDNLRSNIGIIYHPRGRIALAITCDEMPEPSWTVDNPAMLLMSRLSELVIDGLGKPIAAAN
jgi:beta-lactamase class A